ncbi:GH92 family glycosyl hydrolase [Rheinheimera texasensis]|uniref:GH92 family glycosyl hydrolase n=1 Tax=Rheinheimera texasensis TaxID=306205 RepID=UPI0032B0F411
MGRGQKLQLVWLVPGLAVSGLLLSACQQQHSASEPATPAATESSDPLHWVNPLIGTDGKGKTYPGATVPYGMVQLSPDNGRSGWDWISGYFYPDRQIAGFSHLHLSGTGAGDLYDISFLPFSGEYFQTLPAAGGKDALVRSEHFSHATETASPGYYRVLLEDSQIEVELTAALRSGLQRYRYLKAGAPAMLQLDLTYSRNWDSTTATCLYQPDAYTLAGYRFSSGWAKDQKVFFYSKSSVPLVPVKSLSQALPADLSQCAQSGPTLFTAQFTGPLSNHSAGAPRELLLRTALSSVSVAGAAANLTADLATQTSTPAQQTGNFAITMQQAQAAWRTELSQVQIEADAQTKTQFYTALYHSALAPRVYSDADGQYRGPDGKVHSLQRSNTAAANQSLSSNQHYDFFSLWDTFRALHPWKTLFDTPRHQAMMFSLLEHYQHAGRLPVWNFQGNETDMMLGYHAVPVLVDSYLKGLLPDPDGNLGALILQAALTSANDEQNHEKFGIQSYRQLGYVPFSERPWNVALTLEYAFDDSAVARLAHKLGKPDIAAEFDRRAQNYRQHFDAASGFMRAKDQQSQFRLPFNPEAYHPEDYCEANAWQYSFFVPHDVSGLIKLHGGQQAFVAKLDAMFLTGQQKKGVADPVHSVNSLGDNHGLPEWISGFIGQYVHGNEPSHHVPYLYALAGRPDKTQTLVRQIMRTLYQPIPDGLAGNEDAGQMSAWYLFSALGFYPVDPVSGDYVLGSPLVSQATLRLGNGKVLKIIANNQSEQHPYVKAVRLNGKPLRGALLSHQALMRGGLLEFEMSATATEQIKDH